jgi:hypothetical protein
MLCTVFGFVRDTPKARRLTLVYLFKRGRFYPFAPTGPRSRDTSFELQVRAQLAVEPPVEADLGRWFPIWNAPAWSAGHGR